MKKQLLWALTLVLLALFPYQNATAGLVQLNRTGWSVTASSEETTGEGTYKGYASNTKDGNTSSFWHSKYTGGNAPKPHWIMFDLGSVQTIDAFNYVSRMASTTACNGNIKDYKLYISTSAPTTTNIAGTMQEVASGTFTYNGSNTEHLITLNNSVEAQYVLLYAVSTYGSIDNTYANCSEFYLYKNDYCTPSGNMANSRSRKLNSFTLSDGTNSVSVSSIQASYTDAMYKDKTASVLTTTQGATLRLSALDWDGSWMHGYVYIDYNGDKTFNTTANNNGATEGELVSYNYYSGSNILGTTTTDGCGVTKENIPSWTLPSDLPVGEYRLRFKIDWNSLDPCGSSEMASNNGCVVDITLNVESSAPSNSRPQDLFTSSDISQTNKKYPHRIPGIAKAYNNNLIAVAAHLVCGTDPGYGQVDVSCRVSKDNGVTWSDTTLVAVGNASLINANTNVFEIAYGDPAIVADRTSNKVAIFVVAGCTHYVAATRSNPNMIGVIYGTYNETTGNWEWEKPKNITEDIYKLFDSGTPIKSAFIAGGKVFQSRIVKKEGSNYYRLYAAMNARDGGNRVVYSDDFGATWHVLGGASAQPVPSGDEPKCEEMPDGRVIISSRKAAGRYYNIFTYTNTATGEGSWGSVATSSFDGAGRTPGGSAANGEMLIVPVKRNNDSKDMYLALQSLPTGDTRTDVCIYYKELTSFDDMNTPANLSAGWNGYYHVTTLESAYSSMDLQADGKVGFIYEETLTRDGTVQNPVTTTFPNGVDPWGSSTHNFDGYNNIYRAYTIEQLTNNAYSLKEDINRGNFVKTYLTSAVDASNLPTATKDNLKAEINKMGAEPTTAQVDAIYNELNKDPWDGKVVTFTNIQSNGDQRALYITGSVLSLGTTSQTAESIGASAQFLCKKETSGKYSFKNIATNEYMIWRATDGADYSHNSNKGTLSSYDATYCDWLINDANSTKANTYCLVGKRGNGTDDGSLIVAQSSGAFDAFGATPICGQHTNNNYYSNVYYINIVSSNVEQTLATAEEIISKTGVGYPKQGSTARTNLQNAINTAKADASVVNGIALQNAINSYYASTDVELPTNGVLYSFIVGHETQYYIYNNGGTLAIAPYTEGTTELPATAKFTCEVNGDYFMFRTSDGKYMAFPTFGSENYTDASPDGIEDAASDKTKFSLTKLYNKVNVDVTKSNESLFGKIYLTVLLRGHKTDGGAAESGVFVIKIGNDYRFDGAAKPYDNGDYSSAISVVEMGYPLTATAEPAEGASQAPTVTPAVVEKGGSATFTASAANEGYIFGGWYNGAEKLSDELEYTAQNITTPLSLTAKYIAQGVVPVTVPSTFGKVMKGEEVVDGSITGNAGATVTLTAVPDAGYIFDRWVVKNTENIANTDKSRIKTENPIEVTLGTYEVEAYFAPEAYKDVCKPSFTKSGNTTVVSSAEITNGEGVEDGEILGVTSNLWFNEEAVKVRGDLGVPAQSGATKAVAVEQGATFTLDMTLMLNWHDITIYMLDSDDTNTEKIYGPYEGDWVSGGSVRTILTNIQNAGITVDAENNKVSFPITISENLENGELVVVRMVATQSELFRGPCDSVTGEGAYLDFVFVVKNIPERTISVNVAPAGSATILMNDEEKSSITAEGVITMEAQPKAGYIFEGWYDSEEKLITAETTLIDKSKADNLYTAKSVKVWNVTASSNNEEWGTVAIEGKNSSGSVDNAASITLTATPAQSCRFIHWTLDGKPITTQNPFTTTILKDEVYQAVFEKDYPTMKVQYRHNGKVANEARSNRYLKSVTAVAGSGENEITTQVFTAEKEEGLPRKDAEQTAYAYYGNHTTCTPTTTGALIDKTGNSIKVVEGETSITLNFFDWDTPMTVRGYGAEPELDQTQQAIFVDWNNDKDFLDENEKCGEAIDGTGNFETDGGYSRTITVPANTPLGSYRMRVIYHDVERLDNAPADWATTIFNDCLINEGRAYDFSIRVVENNDFVTFDAPGETTFIIGDVANITMTYKDGMDIYYTTTGIDPDASSPSIKSGEQVAISTRSEGMVTLKAMAYDTETEEFTSVYTAIYNIMPQLLNEGVTISVVDDATTIVAASISDSQGKVKEGELDYPFAENKQLEVGPIVVAPNASFKLNLDIELKKYGMRVYEFAKDKEFGTTKRFAKDEYLGSTAESVDAAAFESSLNAKGYQFTKDGTRYSVAYPISIEYAAGSTITYRFITTNKNYDEAPYPSSDQGNGGYVDFIFVVEPQSENVVVAGTAAKQLNVSITTDADCYVSVGGNSRNVTAENELTLPVSLNAAGEIPIEVVGGNISNMDIEVVEIGTNVLLPEVDYLGVVTLKSDAKYNATTVSSASVLPESGVKVVVEKEIYVPYTIDGKMPTYFNFLSMPFDFYPGLNIEYYHPTEKVWKQAVLEQDIRILTYKGDVRAKGRDYYNDTWKTWGGTADKDMIFANHGFVLVGNSDYGDAEHKMKVRFKSFYPEKNDEVQRETIYKQDGSAKTIGLNPYRNNQPGGTHTKDADWNHIGSPYLTHCDGFDYILYFHDGYKWVTVEQSENPVILPYQSVLLQANLGELAAPKEITAIPLSLGSKTNAADGVYGRANLAINDEECVKIVLKDEASENFVVNEDAWYMAPTANVFSTMSVSVAGGEASITVQPEPTDLPLTVYAGAKAQQTISLSRFDGENNIFLKDAVTDEVVCLNDEDYTFTATPYSKISDRFTITMIEPTGIADQAKADDGEIKAVVTADGIKLFGTVEGEEITLYSANGMVITNAVAQDGVTTIETSATGVIIIKVAEETVKVVK